MLDRKWWGIEYATYSSDTIKVGLIPLVACSIQLPEYIQYFVTGKAKLIGKKITSKIQTNLVHIYIYSKYSNMFYHTTVVKSGGKRTLRLSRKSSKSTYGSPFVKIYAIWYREGTCKTRAWPRDTFSQTKWISILICLVRWWWTGLPKKYIALTLSQ